MKKMKNSLKNNSGSALVSVIIGITFLVMLGTLVLILSYTDVAVKTSERKGEKVVYDASTAMDKIKLGLEDAVSDALRDAYQNTLKDYSRLPANEYQTKFAGFFSDSILHYYVKDVNAEANDDNEEPLFMLVSQKYNSVMLKRMITNLPDFPSDVDVSINDDVNGTAIFDYRELQEGETERTLDSITLKDVCLEYTENGRTTSITTDVNVAIPDVSYYLQTFSMYGIPSYSAIVAKSVNLNQDNNSVVEARGNVYAGDVLVNGANSFTFNGDRFICRDGVTVSGMLPTSAPAFDGNYSSYNFVIDSKDKESDDYIESHLWTQEIKVKNASRVALLGTAYVADDLDINTISDSGGAGTYYGAEVVLGGRYYGFGTDERNAAKSSAIVINSKNKGKSKRQNKEDARTADENVIRFEGLKTLRLSGYSFIDMSENDSFVTYGINPSPSYKTGESVSVKENQRAYIVPAEFMSYIADPDPEKPDEEILVPVKSNPDVLNKRNGEYERYSENDVINIRLDSEKPIWKINNIEKSYSDYGVTDVVPIVAGGSAGEQVSCYYFLKFSTSYYMDDAGNYVNHSYTVEENGEDVQKWRNTTHGEIIFMLNEDGSYTDTATNITYIKKQIGKNTVYVHEYTVGSGADEREIVEYLPEDQKVAVRSAEENEEAYFLDFSRVYMHDVNEYMSGDSPTIDNYIVKYLSSSMKYNEHESKHSFQNTTMGNNSILLWMTDNGAGKYYGWGMESDAVETERQAVKAQAEVYQTWFPNFCYSLNSAVPAPSGEEYKTPFDYYVKCTSTTTVSSNGGQTIVDKYTLLNPVNPSGSLTTDPIYFKDSNNKNVGVVINNGNSGKFEYTPAVKASNPDVCIIVAAGDVEVSADYEGLIICGGSLTFKSDGTTRVSLKPNKTGVQEAYIAKAVLGGETIQLRDFLTSNIGDTESISENAEGAENGVSSLVTFENWKKN